MKWINKLPTDLPAALQDKLIDPSSMTKRLQQAARQSFAVNVLQETWANPDQLNPTETQLLQLAEDEPVKIREVQLLVDNEPWIYACTLLPASTLNDEKTGLQGLGAKPLGQVLFNNPSTVRHAMMFSRLTEADSLYQKANKAHAVGVKYLWARRSLFTIQSRLLLLYEVFLPGMNRS